MKLYCPFPRMLADIQGPGVYNLMMKDELTQFSCLSPENLPNGRIGFVVRMYNSNLYYQWVLIPHSLQEREKVIKEYVETVTEEGK